MSTRTHGCWPRCSCEHSSPLRIHPNPAGFTGVAILANSACLRSAALLLSSLGYYGPAGRITNAVDRVLLEGKHMTPDLGGRSTTTDVTEAVLKLI
jgi:homoisocitrate dehydrogenase